MGIIEEILLEGIVEDVDAINQYVKIRHGKYGDVLALRCYGNDPLFGLRKGEKVEVIFRYIRK